jgi:hypothetical protein
MGYTPSMKIGLLSLLLLASLPALGGECRSTPNIFGGQDVRCADGAVLRSQPNPFGGYNYSDGTRSRANIFGGQSYSGPGARAAATPYQPKPANPRR